MCKLTLPDIYHGIQQGRFAVSAMERLNARSSSQCQCEKKTCGFHLWYDLVSTRKIRRGKNNYLKINTYSKEVRPEGVPSLLRFNLCVQTV
tara:strand:- start:32 stop:304 length:273 start_codon:yes stop_codon:yes gene_type:complete